MMFVLDLLNKIKWDPRENPKDYAVMYYDRIKDSFEKMIFEKTSEGYQLCVVGNYEDVHIPLHRIREVRKKDKVVWKR